MSIDTLDFCIDIGNNRKKSLLKFPFRKKHGKIVLESCENNFAFRQISTRRPSSSGAEVKTKFPRAGKSSPRNDVPETGDNVLLGTGNHFEK